MPIIKRLKNNGLGPIELNIGNDEVLRLPGRDKKHPGHHISRPMSDQELAALDVTVNVRAKVLSILKEEV